MRKAYTLYIQIVGCILAVGLLAACTDSGNDTAVPSSEYAPLELTLKLPSLLTTESREATGSPTLSGISFNDVWVLQYNEGGSGLLNAKYYKASDITDDESSSDFLVIVPTSSSGGTSYFTNVSSKFYTIVNGGSDLFGTLPEAQLAAPTDTLKKTPYNSASSLNALLKSAPSTSTLADEPGLLIDGPIPYTKEGDKIAIRANLSRTYACINLSYKETHPEDGKFTPTEAVVVNLPTHLSLFTREGAESGVYPPMGDATAGKNSVTANGTENTLFSSTATPSTPWIADTPLTFYMGENLRGTGKATNYQGKNLSDNGPSETLDGCTYLIIRGTYQYCIKSDADGSNPAYSPDGISVEYKLYLGGNLTNDYNIRRNMRYTVTLQISGANSADARVTITDSNVIVFDDSETIENEVTL